MISISELYENGNFHTSLQNFKVPDDYKFHCFHGLREYYVQLTTDRFTNHRRTILNKEWKLAPFGLFYDNTNRPIPPKPNVLEYLENISFILAKIFDYVRIDLYHIPFDKRQKIIVGELTFTPEGGTGKFTPNEWDAKLGSLWHMGINSGL
ncbi:ATP-grasp fold amidoligase family protein [Helicobacter equorum]|uniref:ATP-grasp fold amidoligase family protein n=1 Tax=Helicobacter equorum TaxID=361872 RepID=UPI000CF1AB35|nr:ATP-grasp fold amidoligase family protein [Helicobacter equorum]